MPDITYADKDKNAQGQVQDLWRDVDANEVKTVVNQKQDKHVNLTAISTVAGTAGFLEKTGPGLWQITDLKGGVPVAGDTLNKLYNLVVGVGQLVGGWASALLPTTGTGAGGSIDKGDFWRITAAITIVGIGDLKPGDMLIASINNAAVAADFFAVQSNVDQATEATLGLIKLYSSTIGSNDDGAPTQQAVNNSIGGIQQDQETLKIYKMSNFGSP